MISLPSLLAKLVSILQSDPLCGAVAVLETRSFSSDQFYLKVRAELVGGYNLQVRIYHNHGHMDYAYQLFSRVPVLRWDNKEEFSDLETYPHHHHDQNGAVRVSPLRGDPETDLPIVLKEVSVFLG